MSHRSHLACLVAVGALIAWSTVQLAGHAEATPLTASCFGSYLAPTGAIYAPAGGGFTWGTSGDDVIIGSDFTDNIYGLGGNDRICAGGGNDYVEGGLLAGGSGVNDVDHIDGGTGSDILHGGELTDYIYGGSNFTPAGQYQTSDWLYGDAGDDLLYGEGGLDALTGGSGGDFCDGGTGMAGNSPEDDIASGDCNVVVNTP